MKKQEIKRTQAASFIEEVLVLASHVGADDLTAEDVANNIKAIALKAGLNVPEKCSGEAHSNAFIDNCSVCMGGSAYGFVAPHVKIK